jgi:hypothetical protein
MNLSRYDDPWADDDPHANFKADVANYTVVDPLPTLETLSRETGIPVPCLVRYILVKWAASGSEALLEMSPIVLTQMQAHIDRAEAVGTAEARLQAYTSLRQMLKWLTLPLDDIETAS